MNIVLTTAFSLAQAKLYEIEQANYWVMRLRIEFDACMKDNLTFTVRKSGYQDVYFNPLWVICVKHAAHKPQDVFNEYVRAVREHQPKG